MPHAYTKEEVLSLCEKERVKFVDLQFTDLLGQLKAVTIPIEKLGEGIDSNVWFDGSSIEGFARISESDMYLKLDLYTFAVLPWSKESVNVTARLFCDVYKPNGEPYESDPRYILKQQIARAERMGYVYYCGPELEFFLLKRENGNIVPMPHDHAGYFDQATDAATEVRKEMTNALQELGIEVEALHHEVADGQHEIDFKYGDPLTTADNATTFKYALKMIAAKHGLHATFMPKPFFGINGSGMHVHQSIFTGGNNAFYDANDAYGLSELARYFIAGQLKHIKAMNAVLNPLVNSYKRLVVGYEAPVYLSWGQTNRSALIRVPRINPARPKATRAELRCPDPSANPYLAFAVMLAAGLDGIENKLMPPTAVEESVYEFSEEDMKNRGIETLPADLYGSLRALAKDELIKNVLGDVTYAKYYAIKMKEWDEFRIYVTDWERDRYLGVY
ncbi:MAG: type I glutamate--ammonia ligase [Candidatus Magasanikbacteria bacterium]